MAWEGEIRGTKPPLFERLIDHYEQQVPGLMWDGAEAVGDRVVTNTRHHTPTAGADAAEAGMPYRGKTDVPGKLKLSINKVQLKIFTELGVMVYETGAETDVDYGPYVECGTGLWGPAHAKYPIEPKNPDGVLSWVDRKTGHRVYAKRVMHPGSPGAHMFAIGVAETEAEFVQVTERAWHDFRRRCEKYHDRGGVGASGFKRTKVAA